MSNHSKFVERLTSLVADTPPRSAVDLPHVRRAFEDTLAVAWAGWGEPVTRNVARINFGERLPTPVEALSAAPEAVALLLGTAAHALDYDDVHQTSSTHPSAPIVAALMPLLHGPRSEPGLSARAATAFQVGLATNVALGRVMGYPHYELGWHATSTIGPMAAAAAVAYLLGLDQQRSTYALGLAAAQCGGLQRNFGTMAKPVQAGLAAAAGLRAALLAEAGITADTDVFGPKGYFDLYGGSRLTERPEDVPITLDVEGISFKLYPCCYGAHRPIATALDARGQLQAAGVAPGSLRRVEVTAAQGAFIPLRVTDPSLGSEAKFCGAYAVACALLDGEVTLAHFEDQAVQRAEVRALLERVTLSESNEAAADGPWGRPVVLTAWGAGEQAVARAEVSASPGSPQLPPTEAQVTAKVRDCLAHHERGFGPGLDYNAFQAFLDKTVAIATLAPQAPLRRAAGD